MQTLQAVITEEDGGYVSYNPETDVASQGDTLQEATDNLAEAVGLYLEVAELAKAAKTHKSYITTITV